MEFINGHIQVYNVWVNGRDINDNNQHYPIDNNIRDYNEWHTDLNKAVSDFQNVKVLDSDIGEHADIYSDYHIVLYSIDINVEEFENKFDLDFNLEDTEVQEMIPYYIDYNFNVVAERIGKF